ncbi:Protein Dr1, partial [Armadillidium nasatum]
AFNRQTTMNGGNFLNNDSQQQSDEEMTIPRAAMNKMIKEILPNVRVAVEARELILHCCTLDKLGFGDYRADAEMVLKDCKAVAAKKRRKNTRLENLGIPEEELLRQQQELFAKASYGSIV